jgi:Zn-dependent M28 family amino/carboxypeptidase
VAAAVLIRQPVLTSLPFPGAIHANTATLRRHVEALAAHRSPDYVAAAFRTAGIHVTEQTFVARGKTYRNVIATFGHGDPLLVIGAHYDAFDDLPGADDNASGAAGLLELGRMLACTPNLASEVMLVAYANEEPPFFASDDMGSAVHAAGLSGRPLKMICLEMIGFYTPEQPWTTWTLRALFPSDGEFAAVAGGWRDGALTREVKRAIAGAGMEVASATLPHSMIDASDQRNYWSRGWPAVMIGDTAYLRNPNYHTRYDTPEKLDYVRMARVVDGVFSAAVHLAGRA